MKILLPFLITPQRGRQGKEPAENHETFQHQILMQTGALDGKWVLLGGSW